MVQEARFPPVANVPEFVVLIKLPGTIVPFSLREELSPELAGIVAPAEEQT